MSSTTLLHTLRVLLARRLGERGQVFAEFGVFMALMVAISVIVVGASSLAVHLSG